MITKRIACRKQQHSGGPVLMSLPPTIPASQKLDPPSLRAALYYYSQWVRTCAKDLMCILSCYLPNSPTRGDSCCLHSTEEVGIHLRMVHKQWPSTTLPRLRLSAPSILGSFKPRPLKCTTVYHCNFGCYESMVFTRRG